MPRFRFFISYASEDEGIAIAVSNAIQIAVSSFAEVFIADALPFGLDFNDNIRRKLDDTNVLIVIHSGIVKPAFSYPGLELGYFIARALGENKLESPRRIVPLYFEKPPDAIAERQGYDIGISRATLNMSVDDYETGLSAITLKHRGVILLRELQEMIDKVRLAHGERTMELSAEQEDLPNIIRKLQLAIFKHLKETTDPESTLKPQLQIVLATSDEELSAANGQLPASARLRSVAPGRPLSTVFGIQPLETTWREFLEAAKVSKFRDSWSDAITKVVRASLQNSLATDSTEVIVAYDERTAYRIILTTGVRYFNGQREFNIYFVRAHDREEMGDPDTTLLFKGLDLFCRFRFMFLETGSPFSRKGAELAMGERLREFAARIERELNLLSRDALEAGLDDPAKWFGLIDPDLLVLAFKRWSPIEVELRDALRAARNAGAESLHAAQNSLMNTLTSVENTMGIVNADAIAAMADRLKSATAPTNMAEERKASVMSQKEVE